METLAVNPYEEIENPRKKRRRKSTPRRRSTRRKSTPRRRRRRRRNPATLRIINPSMSGVTAMFMPAAMVSVGAVAGEVIPARFLKNFATTKNKKAMAAAGVGIVAMILGSRFLGRKNAEYIALGAIASSMTSFIKGVLPADWTMAGMGAENLSEEQIDDEMRRLEEAGISLGASDDYGMNPEEGFSTVDELGFMRGDIEDADYTADFEDGPSTI